MALKLETCQMDPNGLLAVSFTFKSFKVSDVGKQLIDPITRIYVHNSIYIYIRGCVVAWLFRFPQLRLWMLPFMAS